MTAARFESDDNRERRPEGIEIARIRPNKIDIAVDSLYQAKGAMFEVVRQQQPAPVELPSQITGHIMKSEVQPEVLRKDATRYHQNRVTQDAPAQSPSATNTLIDQPARTTEVVDPVADAMAKVQAAHGAQEELDAARARLEAELKPGPQEGRVLPFDSQAMRYEQMDERAA